MKLRSGAIGISINYKPFLTMNLPEAPRPPILGEQETPKPPELGVGGLGNIFLGTALRQKTSVLGLKLLRFAKNDLPNV